MMLALKKNLEEIYGQKIKFLKVCYNTKSGKVDIKIIPDTSIKSITNTIKFEPWCDKFDEDK